ncbi:hypothetical protein Ccrd_011618 [Cynara cardunculus var. scolymus]|uniref:Uncharacterized protein n=1 Tax=Cynara cardunculus var. scolymus TaxID=59895 RepID=A0A118K631_CYNCS|nr:hypothetical protein Ccrd_011618 [Cynara cardunculus var. scolymus]
MKRSNGDGFGRVNTESSNGEGGIEILTHLSDYTLPSVDPEDFAILIAAFNEDRRSESVNGMRYEIEGV